MFINDLIDLFMAAWGVVSAVMIINALRAGGF